MSVIMQIKIKLKRKPRGLRMPVSKKVGYAIRPKKGKGSYRRVRRKWWPEDEDY